MKGVRIRNAVLSVVILTGLAFAVRGLWAFYSYPPIRQPIAFNHKLHKENGLQCSDCHQLYSTGSRHSGRPGIETCMTCHEAGITNSPEEKKLLEYGKKHEEIPWKRLYRVPQFVYYSHFRHVVLGKIACETCHGDIGDRTEPPPRPLKQITMDTCRNCHRQKQVTTDCNRCHI